MYQSGVCPSIGLSVLSSRCCRFAAVGPAPRRYRLIAARLTCGGQMQAVPLCQHS